MKESSGQSEPVWFPGTPLWFKILVVVWMVLSFIAAFIIGIDSGFQFVILFLFLVFLLPLVLFARLARQGKWRRKD